jgi:hypothetical protein
MACATHGDGDGGRGTGGRGTENGERGEGKLRMHCIRSWNSLHGVLALVLFLLI